MCSGRSNRQLEQGLDMNLIFVLMLIVGKNLQIQDMNSTRGESPDPGVIEYYVVSTSPHVCWSWSQINSLYSDEHDDH